MSRDKTSGFDKGCRRSSLGGEDGSRIDKSKFVSPQIGQVLSVDVPSLAKLFKYSS